MELVIGLSDAKQAHVVTDQGKRESMEVTDLRARGTPNGKYKAKPLTTDFSNWQLLNVEEANWYPSAFGIKADMRKHQTFEFSSGECRYIVPAIVLIRALLKDKASLMLAAFQPQGLERTITPIFEDDRLTSCWIREVDRARCNGEFLLWLYAYPSVRTAFHSIFQYALQGSIGLTLPTGTALVSAKFSAEHRQNKTRYVTDLSIRSVKTEEMPLDFFQPQSSEVRFHHGTDGFLPRLQDRDVPLGPAERSALCDAEWSDIQPILVEKRFKHNPRQLLDGILLKLVSGTPWRDCEYATGTWSNASFFYRTLRNDGRWSRILAVLHKHRTAEV
jgi:hypothetical protein